MSEIKLTPGEVLLLTPYQRRVLRKVPLFDAYWTSDIAMDAGLGTAKTGRILRSLEKRGLVVRVVSGNPTSWRRAAAEDSK